MPKETADTYKNKDFTDYFLLFRNSGREREFFPAFNQLVEEAKDFGDVFPELLKKETVLTEELQEKEYENINFYESIEEKYINKPIAFNAIVRGEGAKPYICPLKARITCEFSRGEKCAMCGLFITGGTIEVKLDNINPLELIDCNDITKINLIKRKVGIMHCSQFTLELLEQKYIQEIFLSPIVSDVTSQINPEEDEKKEQRFIVRHAFSEGAKILPNKAYKFYGVPTSLPKNQSLVYYIKNHKEEESDLDNFKLSKKDIEDLQIFKPIDVDDYSAIQHRLDDIYNDFSVNLSPVIRFRNDIMLCCDLSFHSVLNYYFGTSFEKGWVECLIVGDTSTGKTKIASKLISHYKLGVIQGAENSTIAGLIGGMTKFESINVMTWGLLPLNNSRLVVLDEMSGINKDVFGELTRIRSEGIAERTIVGGSSSTNAKVRLIWLSNPRKRAMNLYDNGCDMVKELVGNEEDISRFDFVLTVSNDEVKSKKINTVNIIGDTYLVRHKYLSEYCNKLVLWAWSRKANNIMFGKDVEKLILHYAIKMSDKYTSHFPLVLGSTIRLKIAKLSIALAARLFSTDDNAVNIKVNEHHVTYIYEFLQRIYDKPSFGYGSYSEYFRASESETTSGREEIVSTINAYCKENTKSFILNMLTTPRITALEIRDFAHCSKDQADGLRTKLVSGGFIIKKAGFYVKSDIFRKILKKELEDYKEKEQ